MKSHAILTAILLLIYPAAATAHSASSSSNRATSATTHPGQHKAATPAMPGNSTAQAEVIRNRAKEMALRADAANRAAAGSAHANLDFDHHDIDFPADAGRPQLPDIDR